MKYNLIPVLASLVFEAKTQARLEILGDGEGPYTTRQLDVYGERITTLIALQVLHGRWEGHDVSQLVVGVGADPDERGMVSGEISVCILGLAPSMIAAVEDHRADRMPN